ncbi:hypothetical protein HMPREF0204_13637 [Chryseobacterium gleum ATCC 35910]|uniref:Uncharacterized protein n=1 Tax=Chryseobacterium gleum ATCC 35910 TaxID=525257 RepID=A0ABN0ANA3_CHRGE|nr:hypothetical protein HMPREF0204_13637 [Chryseobacterium gleum ATCC 35910]
MRSFVFDLKTDQVGFQFFKVEIVFLYVRKNFCFFLYKNAFPKIYGVRSSKR